MNRSKRNIKAGKVKIIFYFFSLLTNIFLLNSTVSSQEEQKEGSYLDIVVLDKVSSKNYKLEVKIGEEKKFKNILIKPLKCKNSEFDDNPEIIAYLQVREINNKDKNEVFIFNGWTFSSSPTLRPFDHPVYDIWITKCQ